MSSDLSFIPEETFSKPEVANDLSFSSDKV